MAAATLVRRTSAAFSERLEYRGITVEVDVEDYELAAARLEWARATARCLHLPAQREALDWHLACCETAYALLHGTAAADETA
jgi:hypothetical protein